MTRNQGDKGLDESGFIRREGSLEWVDTRFDPLVQDLSTRVRERFGTRLNGLYLYGSIPRGSARIGESDLDAVVVVTGESDTDPAEIETIGSSLDKAHDVVDGVGIGYLTRDRLLDPAERFDLGFFVTCLCTPLLGEDLGNRWPPYRPTIELARGINADYSDRLAVAKQQLVDGKDPRLVSRFSRKVVRTAFCLVLHRWQGWSSDIDTIVNVFGDYYPERLNELREAAALVRHPSSDPETLLALVDGFGAWLSAAYSALGTASSDRI